MKIKNILMVFFVSKQKKKRRRSTMMRRVYGILGSANVHQSLSVIITAAIGKHAIITFSVIQMLNAKVRHCFLFRIRVVVFGSPL